MNEPIDQKIQAIANIIAIPMAIFLVFTFLLFRVSGIRQSALTLFLSSTDFAVALAQGLCFLLVLLSPIAIALFIPGFLAKIFK